MKQFLRTTLVGGVIFLLPVAAILFVLGHALRLVLQVIEPLLKLPQVEALGVVGIGAGTLLAIVVLLLICFAAGMVARTVAGKHFSKRIEDRLIGRVPMYRMMKSMAEGLAKVESEGRLEPALVSIEGGWQLAYVLEKLDHGWVAVMIPQAPAPMSGSVMYLPEARVRKLAIPIHEAMALVQRLGLGSRQSLDGFDLTLPEGQ